MYLALQRRRSSCDLVKHSCAAVTQWQRSTPLFRHRRRDRLVRALTQERAEVGGPRRVCLRLPAPIKTDARQEPLVVIRSQRLAARMGRGVEPVRAMQVQSLPLRTRHVVEAVAGMQVGPYPSTMNLELAKNACSLSWRTHSQRQAGNGKASNLVNGGTRVSRMPLTDPGNRKPSCTHCRSK